MPTKYNINVSLIILSLFTVFYLLSGYAFFKTGSNTLMAVYVVCGLVSLGSIVGIKKGIKLLLWLGIILGSIKILDGISSIANKFIFKDDILIGGHLIFAALYLIPIKVMFQKAKSKKV